MSDFLITLSGLTGCIGWVLWITRDREAAAIRRHQRAIRRAERSWVPVDMRHRIGRTY